MNSNLNLNPNDFKTFVESAGLEAKKHQEDGVAWMLQREKKEYQGVSGGIIADEMGLGKTIMMIGTMMVNPCQRTLIVLPVALLEQWQREIRRTTKCHVLVFHGKKKKNTPLDVLKAAQIVLVTYHEIKISLKEFDISPISAIHQVEWDRIIFDEAHHLRNKTAQRNGATQIKAKIRWLITGTPIQNRQTDLFSLCHVLGFADSLYGNTEGRQQILENAMLRRTKAGVGIGMPALNSVRVNVPWGSDAAHDLADEFQQLARGFGGDGFAEGIRNEMDELAMAAMLVGMIRGKQMCTYPQMLKNKADQYYEEGYFDDPEYAKLVYKGINSSAKLNAVTKVLESNKTNGKQKLIFCHFRMEMDEIKRRCEEMGMKTGIVDGRIKGKKRSDLLEKQNLDVLILQINTCCEGLNLQKFSEIYFVTPHWNPAVEDQAVARAHRIGQTKDVEVFRFYMTAREETQDTFCKLRQEQKREIYI
jgi:SNF2 family DNA or RNA helicase